MVHPVHRRRPRRPTRPRRSHPSEEQVAELFCVRLLRLDPQLRSHMARLQRRLRGPIFELSRLVRQRVEERCAEEGTEPPRPTELWSSSEMGGERFPVWEEAWEATLEAREKSLMAVTREGRFFTNCQRIAETLDLSAVEHELLLFAALCANQRPLALLLEAAEPFTIAPLLAVVLDAEETEVITALYRRGALRSSGLVLTESDTDHYGGPPVRVLEGLELRLLEPHDDLSSMLRSMLGRSIAPEVPLAEFDHVGPELGLLRALVAGACVEGTSGVNVLVHGPPGTGKSELVRALAEDLGVTLFEVPSEDKESGSPLGGVDRLCALRLTQRLAARLADGAIVVFDEAEDIFPNSSSIFGFMRQTPIPSKAFLNDALESAPVATLWISNARGQIDRAHQRRFDLVLRVDAPPPAVRRRMLDRHLGALDVSEELMGALSREPLTPAEMRRLAKVAQLASGFDIDEAVRLALSAGSEGHRLPAKRLEGPRYDPTLSAASHDLAELGDSLRARGHGTVLLHGPPGTGKTAFVEHLAERIERPLVRASASNLLSKWLGETEQQIAELFERGRREQAIVFLDEADSFLRDRSGAMHRWEATQTNELLVQMERFDGIFVCATNLLEVLDIASLRRFDVKIRFEAPDREARRRLLVETLRSLGAEPATEPELGRLDGLGGVFPGDFAAVAKQAGLSARTPNADALIVALQEELRLRGRGCAPVGFHR